MNKTSTMGLRLQVAPLTSDDYDEWLVLAKGYKEFYKTPITATEISTAWSRILANTEISGVGARLDGELVGIAHYLFHTTVWAPTVCYLQDLFTAPAYRGKGVARQLIEFVANQAKEGGADRYYWNTQEGNIAARILYDRVGHYNDFIRYDYPLN